MGVAELLDRDVAQEVGRRDRLGQRLEEPTERGLEREHDAVAIRPTDLDLVPGAGAGPR